MRGTLSRGVLVLACAAVLAHPGPLAARRPAVEVAAAGGEPARVEPPWENPRTPQDVPLDHWAYPLLERLAARGVLAIDLTTRPVSRVAVAAALAAVRFPARAGTAARGSAARDAARGSAAGDVDSGRRPVSLGTGPGRPIAGWLTEREVWAIERLRAEFMDGEIGRATFGARDGRASVGVGLEALTAVRYGAPVEVRDFWPGTTPGGATDARDPGGGPAVPSGRGASSGRGDSDDALDVSSEIAAELWGGVRDLVGFYAEPRVLLGGQDGARVVELSSRSRTWRGIAASIDRAYLMLERPHFAVAAGRRGPAWGRSRWGRLLISGNAPTLDQIDARFSVGPVTFHALHAMLAVDELGVPGELENSERAYLAAHRMVISASWGSVGLSEAVVYSSTIPEPVYLNPLFPYYLAQHNERENDNVQWSFDFLFRPLRGLDVYGEFLIDDLQYDRDRDFPDKYGVTVGQTYFGDAFGLDAELTAEYTNVRKWTSSSRVVQHRFAHDGVPLGFRLGPDVDRAVLEARVHPSVEWTVGLTYTHSRKGEGRITDPFVDGANPEPTFPSGTVETVNRLAVEAGYQNLEGFSAGLGVAYESAENRGNAIGEDDDGWEIWAGVRFHI